MCDFKHPYSDEVPLQATPPQRVLESIKTVNKHSPFLKHVSNALAIEEEEIRTAKKAPPPTEKVAPPSKKVAPPTKKVGTPTKRGIMDGEHVRKEKKTPSKVFGNEFHEEKVSPRSFAAPTAHPPAPPPPPLPAPPHIRSRSVVNRSMSQVVSKRRMLGQVRVVGPVVASKLRPVETIEKSAFRVGRCTVTVVVFTMCLEA